MKFKAKKDRPAIGRLQNLAASLRAEAENVSPLDGHSKGLSGSAPLMREWARVVDDIAASLGA